MKSFLKRGRMMSRILLCLGIFLISAFPKVAAQDTLKVISYNIFNAQHPDNRGESTLADIADFILDEDPDLVALQEVDSATHRLAQLNRGRYFSLADSLAHCTGMHVQFGKAIAFDGGAYGLAVLSRKPVNIKKVWLPNPKEGEPRVLLTSAFNTESGRTVTFAATHLDHQYPTNQMAQVKAINNIFSGQNSAAILAGDLNFEPSSKEYDRLSYQWLDAGLKSSSGQQPADTFPSQNPTKRIDYVWLSNNARWKVLSYKTPDVTFSDHRPVVAKIVLHLTD